MNEVQIYTDGACKGNPGPGGWGAWLSTGGHEKELCGGEKLTTNNRMELTAVIEALASLKRSCEVTIHTDSEYVRKGITEWIHGWKQRGWKTADRKPVKNAELWQRLDALRALHHVHWRWVKGHSGNAGPLGECRERARGWVGEPRCRGLPLSRGDRIWTTMHERVYGRETDNCLTASARQRVQFHGNPVPSRRRSSQRPISVTDLPPP